MIHFLWDSSRMALSIFIASSGARQNFWTHLLDFSIFMPYRWWIKTYLRLQFVVCIPVLQSWESKIKHFGRLKHLRKKQMNSPSVKKTEKRKRWQNKQNKVFFSSSLSSLRGHRTMYFFVEMVKKKDPSKGSFCWSPLFHFTAKKSVLLQ